MLAQCDQLSPGVCAHVNTHTPHQKFGLKKTRICNHKHINKIWIQIRHLQNISCLQSDDNIQLISQLRVSATQAVICIHVRKTWLPFFLLFYCHFSLQLCRASLHVLLFTCAFVCLVCSLIQISLFGPLWSIMALLWASGWCSVYKWGIYYLWYILTGLYVCAVCFNASGWHVVGNVHGRVAWCLCIYESDGNWLIPNCMSLGNAGNYPVFQSA